ncbi:MAG TPA: hypothetical protein VN781_06615 [Acidimicrobiales bacterium]|nr:hypothetical protein [Acidimicrobiales bacterium]
MNGRVLGLARYRFAATWRARLSGYLTLVLLIGVVGGLATGAVAGARRTQSSYPALLASTNPSDLGLGTAVLNPALGNGSGYNPTIVAELARLPHVVRVASQVGLDLEPLDAKGAPMGAANYLPVSAGNAAGSVGGEAFSSDRFVITAGRLPDPHRADEFMTLSGTVAAYGWHLGEVIPMGIYTNRETQSPGFGTARVAPFRRIDMRLVGIGLPANSIVEDDVDFSSELGWFTPALTGRLLSCCANFTLTALKVDDPAANLTSVEAELDRFSTAAKSAIPLGYGSVYQVALGKTERAVKPLSLAIGAFGAIAMLAALLIAGQSSAASSGCAPTSRTRCEPSGPARRCSRPRACSASWRPSGAGWCWPSGWRSSCPRWRPWARCERCTRPRASRSTGRCSAGVPPSSWSGWARWPPGWLTAAHRTAPPSGPASAGTGRRPSARPPRRSVSRCRPPPVSASPSNRGRGAARCPSAPPSSGRRSPSSSSSPR